MYHAKIVLLKFNNSFKFSDKDSIEILTKTYGESVIRPGESTDEKKEKHAYRCAAVGCRQLFCRTWVLQRLDESGQSVTSPPAQRLHPGEQARLLNAKLVVDEGKKMLPIGTKYPRDSIHTFLLASRTQWKDFPVY
ncbi:hypothetical protein CEXT_236861 [Caerostris extrusa]|uniref:Uncharacterized protein n=1 Tax=Caerostris extrusa TaxID=172846 RepID=A0AAV4XSM5_CAEEX|nr:hypothetical protein CEXT_236861 [Caerostris extrusa]